MKKLLSLTIIIMMIFSLTACGNQNNISKNTITATKLTEKENMLVSSISNANFVFDFNVDDTYNKASLVLERYEFGKKVEGKTRRISRNIKNNDGTIIFTTNTSSPGKNENQVVFNISINSDSGSGTLTSSEEILKKGEVLSGSEWGKNEMKNIPISDKIALASICYSDGKNMISQSADFYNDFENHLNEIEKYNVAYILRCEFTKK